MSGNMYPISPGVYNILVDESQYMPASPLPSFTAIAYIFSDRGEDNKIKLKTGHDEAYNEYGKPLAKKFKDISYNGILRWLRGGLGAYVCRLTADDAEKARINMFLSVNPSFNEADYSNTVFYELGKSYNAGDVVYRRDLTSEYEFYVATANIEQFEETTFNETSKWQQVFEWIEGQNYSIGDYVYLENDAGEYIGVYKALTDNSAKPEEGSTDWDQVVRKAYFSTLFKIRFDKNDTPNAGEVRLATFEAKGSGESYNGMFLTLSFNRNATYDNDGVPTYDFAIHDFDENGEEFVVPNETGNFTFVKYTDAYNQSTFIEDIFKSYSNLFNFDNNAGNITDAEKSTIMDVAVGRIINPSESDNVWNVFKEPLPADVVSSKLTIDGGNSGSLFVNGVMQASVRDQLIKDFHLGLIDDSILNKTAVPATVIFDLQQNVDVSLVINDFTKSIRDDVFVYHTGKDTPNPQADIEYRYKELNVSNRNSSLRLGYCDTACEYTGDILRVPMFFNKIMDLALMFKNDGIVNVFGGYNERGAIPYIKANTENYKASKQYLDRAYLAQINMPDPQIDGLYYVSTRTLLKKSSKLSLEHVNIIQNRFMLEAEILGRPYINRFITPSLLAEIQSAYSEWAKNKWVITEGIEYIKVRASSNDFMKKNNQVLVEFEISFANIVEKLVLLHKIV